MNFRVHSNLYFLPSVFAILAELVNFVIRKDTYLRGNLRPSCAFSFFRLFVCLVVN